MRNLKTFFKIFLLLLIVGFLFHKPIGGFISKIIVAQNMEKSVSPQGDNTSTDQVFTPDIVRELMGKGENERAMEGVDLLLKDNPEDGHVLYLKGQIFEKQNNLVEAKSMFEKAMQLLPENPEIPIHAGYAAIVLQEYDEAKKYAKKALQMQPDHSEALFLQAQLYSTSANPSDALSYIDNAIMYSPANVDYMLFKFQLLLNSQQIESAIGVLKDTIKAEPENEQLYLLLVGTLQQQGKFDIAQEELEKLVKIQPENMSFRTMAALNLETLGKVAEAEMLHRDTISMDPANSEAHLNLAKFFLRTMEYQNGVNILKIAVSKTRQPDIIGNIYGYITYAEFKSGRLVQAKEAMDKALEINPDQPYARLNQAKFMMQNEQFAEAKALLLELLKDNEWPEIYYSLAMAEENLGESPENVDSLLEQALQLNPRDPEYLLFIAERDFNSGKYQSVQEKIKLVLGITGKNKRQFAHLIYRSGILLGDLAMANEDTERALSLYKNMLTVGLNDPRLYQKLCGAYLKAQNLEMAEASIAKLEEIAPNSDILETLKLQLNELQKGVVEDQG